MESEGAKGSGAKTDEISHHGQSQKSNANSRNVPSHDEFYSGTYKDSNLTLQQRKLPPMTMMMMVFSRQHLVEGWIKKRCCSCTRYSHCSLLTTTGKSEGVRLQGG